MAEGFGEYKHQYVLAAVPFAAYFCMLTFEAGRYSYFNIPFSYVELSAQRIAQIGAVSLVAVLGAFMLLTLVVGVAESRPEGRSLAAKVLLYGILIVPLALWVAPTWPNLLMAVGITLVYATQPPPSGASAKPPRNEVERRLASLRSNTLFLILLCLLCFFAFYKAGQIWEERSSSRVVDAARPNRLVVGVFNGSLVVKTVDPVTRRMLAGFELQPVSAPMRLRASEDVIVRK